MSSGARVSIPNSVRKTIQNIKEITGNHSEEEVYAMLRECSMDPNETTQRLLLQDTFHEVKRKRDKRKENLNNKESAEARWRPGMQGRGGKGGRGNFSPRYVSHDSGGGRSAAPGKENGLNQASEGAGLSPLPTSQETKNKENPLTASSLTVKNNEPTCVASGSTSVVRATLSSVGSVVDESKEGSAIDTSKPSVAPALSPRNDAKDHLATDCGTMDTHGQLAPDSSNRLASSNPTSGATPGVYFSASDPVLVPSQDSRPPGAVGTKIASKPQGGGKNQSSESLQPASSSQGGSAIRPSSNYHIRPQQVVGPQKVGPSKEWKPKPANPNLTRGSAVGASSGTLTKVDASAQGRPILSDLDVKEATPKLQRKLEESHISEVQHVIIPNHLHVPEVEKLGFCFGSFDISFGVSTSNDNDPESNTSPTTPSETSEGIEEAAELPSSDRNALESAEEGDCLDHHQSPTHVPENLLSGEADVSSSVVPEYNESKQETSMPSGSNQYSVVHNSPNYGLGVMPPMPTGQLAPSESSESQARDVSRLHSFAVPQPFDPTSYYAQFYRGAENDGRISPFHSSGVAKYNNNIATLPPQSSQSPQEGGNSLVLTTAAPTPLVTQAAGVMQSSIALTQQPLPVFRQSTGVHIPHYHPNYIPYGHYISPYYVPPPIHQFLGNGAFLHQPQPGSVYPAPQTATAKFSLPQYKSGSNTGNSTHIGVPGIYPPYGSSPAGYNPNSGAMAGNSNSNEDHAASQFKDNNVYVTGQQSEGSALWITPPSRDISGLQASTFYNIPQGQVTFAPTQPGHGTFTGIYHPAPAVTPAAVHPLIQQSQTMAGGIDMVGPTTSVYQQPQHAQINWPNNF